MPTEHKPQDSNPVRPSQARSQPAHEAQGDTQQGCSSDAGGGQQGQQRRVIGHISVDCGIQGIVRMRSCFRRDGGHDSSRRCSVKLGSCWNCPREDGGHRESSPRKPVQRNKSRGTSASAKTGLPGSSWSARSGLSDLPSVDQYGSKHSTTLQYSALWNRGSCL